MNNWQVKIIDKGFTTFLEVYIFRILPHSKIEMVTSNNTVEIQDDGAVREPTLRLDHEQLQAFADALNNKGINPKKEYVEGKLEATEKHLADMRKLANF